MAVYTEIHIRRDSTLNWYAANPRLALGEPGVDMDLHRFKIGNGIDRWNELPYMDDDLYKLLDKTQQDIADHVQALLNKINTNKIDSDQKINALTTEVRNTSRDLQGRMTAVEDEQAEYEENLTGEFENTKSAVNAGLEEFNNTRDDLTVRMDVIAGSATEDTEILDARVDAENVTHPNLGHNIRSLHSELLDYKAQETSERVTADSELSDRINNLDEGLQTQAAKHESDYDFLNKQIAYNGQLWDWETKDRQRETSQLFEDLTATRQDSSTRDDYLQT